MMDVVKARQPMNSHIRRRLSPWSNPSPIYQGRGTPYLQAWKHRKTMTVEWSHSPCSAQESEGHKTRWTSLECHRSCTRVPATRGPNSHQDQGDNDEQ